MPCIGGAVRQRIGRASHVATRLIALPLFSMDTYFQSIKRYVGFTDADTDALRRLAGPAEPHLQRLAGCVHEHLGDHSEVHDTPGEPAPIARLETSLVEWMRSGLAGPHDEAFYEHSARFGRMHVRSSLPQRSVFAAMNALRLGFRRLIEDVFDGDVKTARATRDAIDKLFDLELAIVLQMYQEDSEERLRRRERLATIGQLAASVGHDLRNPLGVIQSSLYILRKRAGNDQRAARHLDRIDAQLELCKATIDNLLELARNQPPRRAPVCFEEVFGQAAAAQRVPPAITVELDIEPGLELHADAGLLRQAVANLIGNAIDAHDGKPGVIHLCARSDGGAHVLVEVADEGPGFDAETLARAFEPLVTTRPTGTGLGLALVKGITERHGGTVRAYNRPGGGAAVSMRLPAREETAR